MRGVRRQVACSLLNLMKQIPESQEFELHLEDTSFQKKYDENWRHFLQTLSDFAVEDKKNPDEPESTIEETLNETGINFVTKYKETLA